MLFRSQISEIKKSTYDFLYLPEVLYVLFFSWLICSGPGKLSADFWLADKLLR